MIYRKMIENDLEAVSRLEADCFSRPWSEKAFAESFEKNYYSFFVAFDEDKHIGTVAFTKSFDEADISNVAIDKEYRNRGIGFELLSYAMEEMGKSGIVNFTLEVRSKNVSAIRLYEKLGFVQEGLRRGFYSDPEDDAVIMWKRM